MLGTCGDSDQPSGRLALVFELMDMNIYELIRGRRNYLADDRIRSYMYQLMKGLQCSLPSCKNIIQQSMRLITLKDRSEIHTRHCQIRFPNTRGESQCLLSANEGIR